MGCRLHGLEPLRGSNSRRPMQSLPVGGQRSSLYLKYPTKLGKSDRARGTVPSSQELLANANDLHGLEINVHRSVNRRISTSICQIIQNRVSLMSPRARKRPLHPLHSKARHALPLCQTVVLGRLLEVLLASSSRRVAEP